MEVFLDDERIDAEFLAGASIEEAMRSVQSRLMPSGRLVVRLRCNDREIEPNELAQTLPLPASDFGRIEIFTQGRSDLVAETMRHAEQSLEATQRVCQDVAQLLNEGKTVDAIREFGDCIRIWQQVHDAVRKSVQTLEIDLESTAIEGESLAKLLEKPRNLLLEVKQALQAQDHVLLADILQYEFENVSGKWHSIIAAVRERAEQSPE